jgi:hypothetical protein
MKKTYALEAEAKKTGKDQIKKAFQQVLGAERAKFDMKTWSVMKLFLCCRVCVLDRQKFRYKKSLRDDLYFMKGKEKMDRELDVGYIVH